MVSKKAIKREALLNNRVFSKNFVLAYGFTNRDFGLFFGISAKAAKPLRRNSIKRIFRDLVRKNLEKTGVGKEDKPFSICLISKKGVKLDGEFSFIKGELAELVEKLIKKIK